MAAPTETRITDPDALITVSGVNSDAGIHNYTIQRSSGELQAGFSIYTGTLTACTMTVIVANTDAEPGYDATMDFFGVPALLANTMYQVLVPVPVRLVTVRANLTNPVNAVDFSFFIPKGRA